MNVLVIGGPIDPADVPALCEWGRALLAESDDDLVLCDVGAIAHPDAVTAEALARLQLVAKRLGRRVRLLHPGRELQELLDLMGLCGAIPPWPELTVETGRQTEEREHPGGIEEEADPGDLAP